MRSIDVLCVSDALWFSTVDARAGKRRAVGEQSCTLSGNPFSSGPDISMNPSLRALPCGPMALTVFTNKLAVLVRLHRPRY